jgi:alpha-1,3/alpha-1,6-mannosyltransferase|tara:strand:- start:2627 stop:2914 length:288 start_codon:yes stop_codon:yes gene_type:complete
MLMAAGYKASACSQRYVLPCLDCIDLDCIDQTSRPPLVFLSVNRFDSKKNLPLAVVAFKKFCEQNEVGKNYVLIFAGGYDMRISDNVNVLDHLKR